MKKILAIVVVALFVSLAIVSQAEAKELTAASIKTPPNATKVIKNSDGNYYALYKGKVAALTKIKYHARTIIIPKYIKYKNKKYKVIAIHEVGLFERVDVKKVVINATNMETVEEPALFKDWRKNHHKKLTVIITNKAMRKWLEAKW